jgi:hypothetical protein
MDPSLRPPLLTVDAIFEAFPGGVFGLRGQVAQARFAGHGSGSYPPGLTQIDLGFGSDDVRVETARNQALPLSPVVNDLIFRWLVDASLTFPLTVRVESYEYNIQVDSVPTSFNIYAVDGQAAAIATLDDICVTVRCSEAALEGIEVSRFDRRAIEQIANATAS